MGLEAEKQARRLGPIQGKMLGQKGYAQIQEGVDFTEMFAPVMVSDASIRVVRVLLQLELVFFPGSTR
jgi:hypothetical protein